MISQTDDDSAKGILLCFKFRNIADGSKKVVQLLLAFSFVIRTWSKPLFTCEVFKCQYQCNHMKECHLLHDGEQLKIAAAKEVKCIIKGKHAGGTENFKGCEA